LTEREKYINNPFSNNLFYCTQKSLESLRTKSGFKLGQNNFHLLNKTEKYVSRVSKINGDLGRVFDQINSIKIFVRRFPNKKFYYENGIGELDYIQYHTESFIHKVHTILEVMKLIVNEVYCLNIPKKDCNWNSLVSKLDKNTECLKVIDTYYKTFENFIESRHVNTHRGVYNDEEKETIEMKYGLDLYLISKSLNHDLEDEFKMRFPMFMIEYKIKEFKKNRIKLFDQTEKHINQLLKVFLTSLHHEFNKRTKTLYNDKDSLLT